MSAQEALLGCSLCRVFVRESGTFVFMVQLKVRDSSPQCVLLSHSKSEQIRKE